MDQVSLRRMLLIALMSLGLQPLRGMQHWIPKRASTVVLGALALGAIYYFVTRLTTHHSPALLGAN